MTAEDRRQENLGILAELTDKLLIAASNARYSKYAKNFLRSLRDERYDVEIPE